MYENPYRAQQSLRTSGLWFAVYVTVPILGTLCMAVAVFLATLLQLNGWVRFVVGMTAEFVCLLLIAQVIRKRWN
jgi:hypothetical protein